MKTIVPCANCYTINKVDMNKALQAKAICAKCKSSLPIHDGIQNVNGNTLQKLIAKAEIPVVVDFWASWCGPCKMFAPIFKEVAQELHNKIIFAKFDTEKDNDGADQYKIRSIPTMIVFDQGVEVDRQSGAMPKSSLYQYLSQFIK